MTKKAKREAIESCRVGIECTQGEIYLRQAIRRSDECLEAKARLAALKDELKTLLAS